MLMLKLNVANRQKVVELSHANGDKFWGVWGRCLFLMMAPLFSRYQYGRVRLLALLFFVDRGPDILRSASNLPLRTVYPLDTLWAFPGGIIGTRYEV